MAISRSTAMSELEGERRTLVLADRDIREGEARIAHLRQLIDREGLSGRDAARAEDTLGIFLATLQQWQRHRELIVQRIAYLEGLTGSAVPGRVKI